MKWDHIKHDIEQFPYDLKILGKMTGMPDEQVLKYFSDHFHNKGKHD